MPDNSKNTRAAYWDAKIRRWAQSSYTERRADVMSKVRRSVDARKDEAKKLLQRRLRPGYSMLDLGCGAGHFVLEAVEECGAARAIGRDFSPEAIRMANELRDAAGITPERARFEVADVAAPFPGDVDLITGLGLLDWLDERQIDALLARLPGRRFLLSFSEKDNSFDEIVHRVYLVWRLRFLGRGVRAYHHRRRFILGLVEKHGLGPVEIVAARSMRFGRLLHNLGVEAQSR